MDNEHLNVPRAHFSAPEIASAAPPSPYHRIWVNLLLFGVTILTTMMAGAANLGYYWNSIEADYWLLLKGWEYSFALLLILTFHEFGHYLAARYHRMNVTLPYYIPVPIPNLFHFGTMGAFIRLKSPIPDRKVLMDVAVAGPLAGFVVSLVFLFYGYAAIPDLQTVIAHVETIHPWPGAISDTPAFTLGNSALFYFFNQVIGQGMIPMSEVYHFPYIFAGWIGLFITALNLIPIGQLDGGHVVYALLGNRARYLNYAAFGSLAALTAFLLTTQGQLGIMWIPWMIILTLIGLRHPPTLYDSIPLSGERRYLGWLCIVIFVLCFIPLPFYFG